MGQPKIPITDKRFKYVPSHQTNVKDTLDRARKEIAEQRGEKRQVIPMRHK